MQLSGLMSSAIESTVAVHPKNRHDQYTGAVNPRAEYDYALRGRKLCYEHKDPVQ